MYYCCQAGSGLVGEDDVSGSGGAVPARIDSSYMINLRDLDMRHVKDFTFVHGENHIVLFVTILPLISFFNGNDKNASFQDIELRLNL